MNLKKIGILGLLILLPLAQTAHAGFGTMLKLGVAAGCAIGGLYTYKEGKNLWHNKGIGLAASAKKDQLPKPVKMGYHFAYKLYGNPITVTGAFRSGVAAVRNVFTSNGEAVVSDNDMKYCAAHTIATPILAILSSAFLLSALFGK